MHEIKLVLLFCAIGTLAASYHHQCRDQDCGPRPAQPSVLCPDGISFEGPGPCVFDKSLDRCMWSTLRCPATCYNVNCRFNATCQVIDYKATCVCPSICPLIFLPVCGSDGITYGNLCQLEVAFCNSQGEITLAHEGACQAAICDLECRFNATCQIINETAQCVCPSACPADYQPVCGSDGITYGNLCELEVAYCNSQGEITLDYQGECQAAICDNVECRFNSTCQIINGEAQCVCPSACPLDYRPVCGSDGITYGNLCQLEAAYCNSQGEITLDHVGECQAAICDPMQCRFNSTCQIINGSAQCVCPSVCPLIYQPVCGTDGVTYGNLCALEVAYCNSQGAINFVHLGECRAADCSVVLCRVGTFCEVINGVATCVCATSCPDNYDPRCGSDGITYGNECLMGKKECETEGRVTEAYRGRCRQDLCSGVRCGWNATCQVINGKAKCTCERPCTREFRPVCGSDGVTYSNECLLEIRYCQTQGRVTRAYDGACQSPIQETCPPGQEIVECFVAPCSVASCPAHPDAYCVDNYCGGCNADFYDPETGLRVDCKKRSRHGEKKGEKKRRSGSGQKKRSGNSRTYAYPQRR